MSVFRPWQLVFLALVLTVPGYAWWNADYETRQQIYNSTFQGVTWLGNATAYYGTAKGVLDETTYLYSDSGTYAVANDTSEYCFFNSETQVTDCPNPPDNLIAYWTFDDAGTAFAYDLIGSHDGKRIGNPTEMAGVVRNASAFDGTGDEYTVADANDLDIADAANTITYWLSTTHSGSGWASLIQKYDGTLEWQSMFDLDPSEVFCYSNNQGNVCNAYDIPNDGTWVHFASVFNGSWVFTYVNGAALANDALAAGYVGTGNVTLGSASQQGAYYATGNMDDFRIYDRALNATEIQWLYDSSDHAFLGAAEAGGSNNFTFDWQPGTPHVEENTTFNVTVVGYNITDFWWDFNDSTAIYHNTIGNTSHIWYLGGAYNVTLTGLNGSGTNVTTYELVTVTEPTIQVWVQDSVGGGMLNDFSISVWNNTNTTNFTTAGYYVEWDYHEGPRGNVTISAIKPYYNITDGAANITNASNVNVTLSADPAIVIIRARDANFPQLIVPIEVRMDNLTESRYQDSELDEDLITTSVNCPSNPCTNTSTSSAYYGQVFEYTLVATGTNTGAGDIIRAFLYIKDEDGSTQIIDWANKSGGSGTETINRMLYLSEAGYELRSTGGTLIRSSTGILPGYPFRVYTTLHASTDGAGETASATSDINGATTEFEFYIPAGVTLGQTDVVASQKTTSPFAFLGTSYHYQKLSFIIYETSILNYTVYLFRASDAILQNVYIIDNNNDPVTGAYVQAFGTINSSELISSGYSDGSGKVELPLKATQQFYIVASATGYDPESVTIYPSTSALYITLTVSTTEYTGPFTGISYSLDGQEPFQTGQTHNLTLTIADSEAGLLNFSLKVWQNITLVHNDTSTSATGGVMYYEFTVPSDAYGYYTAAVEFYREYESETYYFEANQTYMILTTGTFDELKGEIDKLDGLSKAMWALIALGAGFLVGPIAGVIFGLFMFLIGLISEGLFVLLVLGIAMVYSREVFK